jgi:arylformamidase
MSNHHAKVLSPESSPSDYDGDSMETMSAIHDISPLINGSLSVWPGDTAPRREILLDLARGDSVTLSTLHATVHLGAHADAPSHYSTFAPTIEQRKLDLYLGPCQVIRVNAQRGSLIKPADLPETISAERVLLATSTFPDPARFNSDYAALEPSLVENLSMRGVKLIGIDTPSVDPFDSKDLPAHQAFGRHDMAILEGLVLEGVREGRYELIALPLRLAGFDASPVRAVLRSLS